MSDFCRACGTEVLAAAAFCHHCGRKLTDVVPASEEAAGAVGGASVNVGDRGGAEPIAAQAVASLAPAAGPATEAERTLWEGGYSAKAMLGGWLLAGVATLLVMGLGFAAGVNQALFLGLLTATLCLGGIGLYVTYLKLSVHYRLTTRQFVHQAGLFSRVTDRMEMIDVDDVAFSQGLIQRLVGVGTIKIMSSDTSHPELFLEGIDRVEHVAGLVDEARRTERLRRGLFIEAV